MTVEQRARGCLLGLACGDALGRPVEFRSAAEIESQYGEITDMVGYGTHRQPAGTITDDTEMALCIAASLADRRGFDPADIGDRFVEWLDSDPFDVGLMTRESLTRIRQGTSWCDAGVEVWHSQPKGSNAGNGSVMRCAPHAIAFREFEDELAYVSRLSSAITHADPRCQWGCVLLNRTLANLLGGEADPLGAALDDAETAPAELREALTHVHQVVTGERDGTALEAELSTSGYVVTALQAALYDGLTADSVESAIGRAVNRGGDTDTIGAITGAVAGARFGSAAIPDRWRDEIEDAERLERLAQRLLGIRLKLPGKRYVTLDDGSLIFKERTVAGPAYVPAREFEREMGGHRPEPAPHYTIGRDHHELTPATAAMLDWERRAYAVVSGRCDAYAGPQLPLDDGSDDAAPKFVPVPQYPFVDTFDALPDQDQSRIKQDGRAAADAFVRAYAAFAGVRYPITETETDAIGIRRIDPLAGATRLLLGTFGTVGERLLRHNERNGYLSPDEIEAAFDVTVGEDIIVEQPEAVYEITAGCRQLASGAGAILDYVTQVRLPQQPSQQNATSEEQLAALREQAQRLVGEVQVMDESLRRVALRHPEIEYDRWQSISTASGGR